jgi:hypothetical protein
MTDNVCSNVKEKNEDFWKQSEWMGPIDGITEHLVP